MSRRSVRHSWQAAVVLSDTTYQVFCTHDSARIFLSRALPNLLTASLVESYSPKCRRVFWEVSEYYSLVATDSLLGRVVVFVAHLGQREAGCRKKHHGHGRGLLCDVARNRVKRDSFLFNKPTLHTMFSKTTLHSTLTICTATATTAVICLHRALVVDNVAFHWFGFHCLGFHWLALPSGSSASFSLQLDLPIYLNATLRRNVIV